MAFRRDLERPYEELQGVGLFHSMEYWVEIDVTGDGRGHFAATCRARDRAGDGNVLHFNLSFDQTAIPRMVRQLLAIEAAFLVLGNPATDMQKALVIPSEFWQDPVEDVREAKLASS